MNKFICFCLDQTCYELVYKHQRFKKNEWKIEETDVAEELDKAVVERPTASSNW